MKKRNLHFMILAIFLGLLLGCKTSREKEEERNLAVIHKFDEALNTYNYDLLDEVIKPDFIRHSQATGDQQINSLEEYKEFYRQFTKAFPDANMKEHFLFAKDDMVAGYAAFTGTQKGAFGPFPASGKKVVSETMAIFRIEDGKIAELWVEWDNVAILKQLGFFPPPDNNKE